MKLIFLLSFVLFSSLNPAKAEGPTTICEAQLRILKDKLKIVRNDTTAYFYYPGKQKWIWNGNTDYVTKTLVERIEEIKAAYLRDFSPRTDEIAVFTMTTITEGVSTNFNTVDGRQIRRKLDGIKPAFDDACRIQK